MTQTSSQTGIIAWFAGNPVAANLLLLMIIAFGVVAAFSIRKQTTPDFELRLIQVTVALPGAAPQEVEEGVVVRIEEAIQDVQGIVRINSVAREGFGSVTAEIAGGESLNEVLNEIKSRVDAINSFPELAEKPVIAKQEVPIHVVFLALHGNMDEYVRKSLSQQIRGELMTLPEINQVEFLGDRDYEISIEVSEQTLRKYGLTMGAVADAIRQTSIDLPGGAIKTDGGNILLRTEGQVYTGQEYAGVVLRTYPDGRRLTLGEVARIDDGFVETDGFGRFDGQPTSNLRVLAGGQQNELSTAKAVREFVEQRRATLPDGVELDVWIDRSVYLRDRLDMMLRNMLQGALLVFIVLSLFLRLRVAWWVIVGIPAAFFGALWLMPYGPWPVTINVISLFGFILVLGIVVDDAIIIGESIYTEIRARGQTLDNVITGARRVAVPATFGVLTTMAAFAPMLFVGGTAGPFFEAMSVVVILCLFFSIVESKLILPAHLAHAKIAPIDEAEIFAPYRKTRLLGRIPKFFQRINRHTQHGMAWFIAHVYRPLLERCVDGRAVAVSVFVALLILTVGLLNSGLLRTVLFPDVPSDFVRVSFEMQTGTAPAQRNEALLRLERAALQLNEQWLAENPGASKPLTHVGAFTRGDTGGLLFAEMPLDGSRVLEGEEIEKLWRDGVGEVAGIKELTFSGGNNIGGAAALSFNLMGSDYGPLEAAAAELQLALKQYDGVFDIRSSVGAGGDEISLAIKPEAEALGLTLASLGRQVRQAFYGEEAQRIQRGTDELKVMVRYPKEQRRSLADLENMRIRTPGGAEVPFSEVADVTFGQAYSSITRQNRMRVVTVSADIDAERIEPGPIIEEIQETFIPQLLSRYQGVQFALEGASQEQIDLVRNLSLAALAALFLIYALIAIPLRSYVQPLIIMAVIPFGLIGAALGHLIMDKPISMFSLFGLIALAGVVVNDSLIMVDFINRARRQGEALREAVINAGLLRFRAIVLTSLTTSAGLMPIILERSTQAQFVIPMAISISFGIIFATVITLLLVPALFMLQTDLARGLRQARNLLLGRDLAPAADA